MTLKAIYLNAADLRASEQAGLIADYALSEDAPAPVPGWYVWSEARGLYDGPFSQAGARAVCGARRRLSRT